jgi:hypothetical protein
MKKLYLVFFTILFAAAVFAQDKKVMVVSLNLPAADSVVMFIMNKIDSMDGIAAPHVPMADMKAGSVNYADYDAANLPCNWMASPNCMFKSIYFIQNGDSFIYTGK